MIQYNLYGAVRDGTREVGAAERETGHAAGRGAGLGRARFPANPLISVAGREPRAGIFGFSGPAAGLVRARFPANPLVSVSGREPRAGIFGFSGTAAGLVRARVPANPFFSVSGREPRAGIFEFGGPPAGYLVCRFAPRSPLALIPPFRGAKSSHNFRERKRARQT